MTDPAALLAAYDDQLRTEAETPSELTVTHIGPLRVVTFPGHRGYVTYRDLDGADEATIRKWVGQVLDYFVGLAEIARIEWKSRGHDRAPGLHQALLDHGFVEGETESIMIGEARNLVVDVGLPTGVRLRRISSEPDVRAMCAMQETVFSGADAAEMAAGLLHRQSVDSAMELWVAEAAGVIVSAGRLEPVPHTDFAGIWGGATLESWRGRGIYRALTSVRAQSALALGKTLINSDSTEYSRPILERSGFVKVSTTTPYEWVRE